jgi:hypothetical protein
MKLELKHIAPYLPYGLKVQYTGVINGKELSKHLSEFNKKCREIDDDNGSWNDYPEYNPPEKIIGIKSAPIKKVSIWKNHLIIEVGIKSGGLKKFRISNYSEADFKPILRPLSDFQNKIDGISFSDLITHGYHNPFWQKGHFDIRHLMHHDFELLVSRHADVFGLIDKGLAIDINDLNNEQ